MPGSSPPSRRADAALADLRLFRAPEPPKPRGLAGSPWAWLAAAVALVAAERVLGPSATFLVAGALLAPVAAWNVGEGWGVALAVGTGAGHALALSAAGAPGRALAEAAAAAVLSAGISLAAGDAGRRSRAAETARPGRDATDGSPPRARDVEQQVRSVDAGARPYVLRRAAEQVATEGDREAAISYYGRAINAYLEAGDLAQAAAECRRLLRFAPDVVRAHCTLAVLAIGDQRYDEAVGALEAYVDATLKTATQSYSIPRLRLMAQLANHATLRDTIADGLARLGDAEEADRVRALPPPAAGEDPARAAQRWDQLLRIALTDARELWWLTWTRTSETMPFGTAETTGPALRDSLWW